MENFRMEDINQIIALHFLRYTIIDWRFLLKQEKFYKALLIAANT